MTTHLTSTSDTDAAATADDHTLLAAVVDAVHDAGVRLLDLYSPAARPADKSEMFAAGQRNEEASLGVLRSALAAARPNARWVDDDKETIALPPGQWWAVDAVEGNVNHVHGLSEWGVSVTLLRDNMPLLTAVYQPIGDLTYTAIRGAGAHLNGRLLRTSTKSDLAAAIVATGQAEAGQDLTYERIGNAITTLLHRALLVRATVPSTFPLLLVASGQVDVFWQYEPVLSGIAAGALLITEAGGIVSDVRGRPWLPGSPDILAAAPNLHGAVVEALSTVA